ncbi:ABC-type spermidine/putrescine transport system permease subunit II [Rhizobium sp. BK347]|nr:ABC-type spermidine/putrescine transport system permease subunit II [Rhizobium sp. BK252]MBB3400019.1 ABC-type spermidine/putrescine transport system permease subunit II [Rhizobium sp. BK289]MBB3412599.1 ABC-type spermidine/putrescine transport system permease subunit II [Rhizobium sp. BK284]MBB3480485.1 ABC-type spermidine/putrescine transport system permease subunit II [Rhizobium sp. BK347]
MSKHMLNGYCLIIYGFLLLPILVVVGASFVNFVSQIRSDLTNRCEG